MGQSSPPFYSYPDSAFRQVSTSLFGDHACGILLADGGVRCWGNNGRGQSEPPQEGKFLQVSTGARTTCAIREDESDSTPVDGATTTSIHCWGSRANSLLHHFDGEAHKYHEHSQISLGQDHACATAKVVSDGSSESTAKTHTLECWWMAGSDFGAHRIPVGLEMVA